jgi:two-component system, LuxR family, sensor kinase FixL
MPGWPSGQVLLEEGDRPVEHALPGVAIDTGLGHGWTPSGAAGRSVPRHAARIGPTTASHAAPPFARGRPSWDSWAGMTTWSRASLLGVLLLALTALDAAGAEPRRVLIVHSFGSTAPPFTTHSTAFQSTLTKRFGARVDMDEVSLDMARYGQPDMEKAFVEFLRSRLRNWQPDIVVPIGSPAGRFVVKHRDRLFPEAPVVYTGMDRRTLPADAFENNATFVGESFELAGLVEDILQLAPDTNHIAVVIGASALERFWTTIFQQAFEPFADRVRFTWLNDLSFDEMLRRVATMPPRSFILLALLLRDASGVTHNQDEALLQLRAVANAPINGLYQNQLGLGLVGGRLYQAELQGEKSAEIAIRILRGEPASSFPPLIIGAQRPRYDWRELQRWKIGEDRLPPGSVVEFREPTMWERYRWWIAGVLSIGLLQGALIVQLVFTLARRRRVERELRDSEQRLNLAAHSSGLWSLDLDSGRVWATPRLRELFQLPPEADLTYEALLAVIHVEDRERIRQTFRNVGDTGTAVTLEFRVVRTDGGERWIGTWGHRDDAGRGKVRRWSGASTDITERKLAEGRLRESESRFRIVADSAPVLIWMSGVDKQCTFFNKLWLDFTGRTAEQEMGNGWVEGVHPEDVEACLKGYAEAFDARRSFVLQYRLRRHDGEYRWISDNGVPRYDAHDAFAGYIGSCQDITDRLLAEERLRQVFEAAPNAMIMVSAEGRIMLVNAQGERVFGYQRDELLGLPIETLIPERFRPQHPEQRTGFMAAPQALTLGAGRNLFGRRKDGSEVPVEIGLNPITTTEGAFVVASVIDITERRKAETEAQLLRQELAHISRVATMGEMAGAIVHELSQPLTAILANAQAGLRFLGPDAQSLAEVSEIFQDIVADDKRARTVIQNLQSLFRKGAAEHQPLMLNALINDVASVVGTDAMRRSVRLELDLATRLPLVSGDRVQLQQVVLNLVVNAFDAVADVNGQARTVVLRTRTLDEHSVHMDVADTGPGIADDALASIFEPFVTTKRTGMGMGLSVSRSIIGAHGGKIWAENNPGGGATFHVVLPALSTTEAG